MKKNERLMEAMSFVDEKYVKEAEGEMKKNFGKSTGFGFFKIAGLVASLAIFVGIGLFLFLPTNGGAMDVSAYSGSAYYPLIEKLEPYRHEKTKKPYDNNFELLGMVFKQMLFSSLGGAMKEDAMGTAPVPEMGSDSLSGEYLEVTDNQVSGVIEADIIKATDKHIFKLTSMGELKIYSMDAENSALVGRLRIHPLDDEKRFFQSEDMKDMYLSLDGTKIIIIREYTSYDEIKRVGIISIDVSDPKNPVKTGELSIDGDYKTSRLVGDKLLMVSEFYFNIKTVDYSDPKTYIPTVTRDGEKSLLVMDEIFAPDQIDGTRYSVVASVDINNFEISGVNGLLNFTENVYVSENNVYVTRTYNIKNVENEQKTTERMSDIVALGYTESGLERKVFTVPGSILNQYSMDEDKGYFRVVTSTMKTIEEGNFSVSSARISESASLYVFSLSDGSLVASVENFAPNGDEVVSARFDGDSLYVCTAIVVTMTDPVYFFDLSDYSNITYTDTGIISGFSTSLINLGEGFLLGIGREDWRYNKVEVYEESAGQVTSVAVFEFDGEYLRDYKSYFVNREENLFGFAVYGGSKNTCHYLLLNFDGYDLNVVSSVMLSGNGYYDEAVSCRAILRENYLYLITDYGMKVVDISISGAGENQVIVTLD